MPLKTTNNLTEFQQMLFNTISHDFPNLPMTWQTEWEINKQTKIIELNLVQIIQDMFDKIEDQPLNTRDAICEDYWLTDNLDLDMMIRAERVTNSETCLIFRGRPGTSLLTKYLINMKTNTIKHWDGLPWSEMHTVTKEQGAI